MERRQQCYERFLNREIDRDTFQSVKAGYAAQIERLNNQLAILRQTERDKGAYKKAVVFAKEIVNETATHREIVEALIDKIHVFPGNNIEIHWKVANFANTYETEAS